MKFSAIVARNMNARRFFVHPHAQSQRNHGISSKRRQPPSGATSVVDNPTVPTRPTRALGIRKKMAEMKVSLAASQLSEQVKESMEFWREFRDEYSNEVNSIKVYVGADILQKIWQNKVEFNSRYKCGDKEDDQQFEIQSMKLESCLNQVDEATQLLAGTWSSDHSNDYDSRQHHLAKMRAAGNLVVGLCKRSVINEAACMDLLEELAELEKLVDPKTSTVSMLLHHVDKRPTQSPARWEEGNADHGSNDGNSDSFAEEANTS